MAGLRQGTSFPDSAAPPISKLNSKEKMPTAGFELRTFQWYLPLRSPLTLVAIRPSYQQQYLS